MYHTVLYLSLRPFQEDSNSVVKFEAAEGSLPSLGVSERMVILKPPEALALPSMDFLTQRVLIATAAVQRSHHLPVTTFAARESATATLMSKYDGPAIH